MNPVLPIYAYGNVEALHGIFNAIAMVMGGDDFAHMMRIGILIGFVVVAVAALSPRHLHKSWEWFLAVTVVSAILLLPKADISIEDRTGQQPPVVVSNVPWTLALVASVKSAFGATLTRTLETAFQVIPNAERSLPAELSYEQHGMMFGARLIAASRDAEAFNLTDQGDLTQYIRNCVFPDLGRNLTPTQMAESLDLGTDMGNTNPGLASGYHDPAANNRLRIEPCPNVWDALQARINQASNQAILKAAARVSPQLVATNPPAALATTRASLEAAYARSRLGAAAATASDIMKQNILINATADAASQQVSALNDPSLIMLATMRTQAVAQMNAGNLTQGRLAEEALPLVRNATEAILLASFPVLCVLLMASEARAMGLLFKSYLHVLIWVELWPPMFAIVNYLQTLEAAQQTAGAALLSNGLTGLSVSNASAVFSTSASALGVSAWMVSFVPVLAAAVLFGFDKVMAVTGAMGAGMQGAQSSAGQMSKGNVSMGGATFDQQRLDAYRGEPMMSTYAGPGGIEVRDLASGATVSTYASSRQLSSVAAVASVGEGVNVAAREAMLSAQRHSKSAESATSAAYDQIRQASQGFEKQVQRGLGFDLAKLGSSGVTATEIEQARDSIAKSYSIQDSSSVGKALQASVHVGTPVMAEMLAGIRLQGNRTGTSSELESIASAINASGLALRQQGLQRQHAVLEQWRSGETFNQVKSQRAGATESVASSLRQAQGYREAEAAELARSTQLSSDWQAFSRYAQNHSTEFGNLVEREFQRRGLSVRDGVADPWVHESVVREMFKAGSFRRDGPGGQSIFIAAPSGPGPSSAQVERTRQLAAHSGSHLEASHEAVAPGGGLSGVQSAAARHQEKERGREASLGVTPTATLAGAAVVRAVRRGIDAAAASATDTEHGIRAQMDAGQARLDKRNEQAVRPASLADMNWHAAPGSGTSGNAALDAGRGGAATIFSDAQARNRAKAAAQQAEADAFYREARDAKIPAAGDRSKTP